MTTRFLCKFVWPAIIALFAIGTSGPAQTTNATTVPTCVDLRSNFVRWDLPLRKQGARPTCSVFATVGAMEYAVARKRDQGVPLSVEFANWAGNRAINHDQDGHFFWEIIKGFESNGICNEVEMPYANEFSAVRAPTAEALAKAKKFQTLGLKFHWIRPNDGKQGLTEAELKEIKDTLVQGWPVAAGSYHSILLVGYTNTPALDGGGEFLVRDSGGGNEQTLTYGAAAKRICDAFWVESPVAKNSQ